MQDVCDCSIFVVSSLSRPFITSLTNGRSGEVGVSLLYACCGVLELLGTVASSAKVDVAGNVVSAAVITGMRSFPFHAIHALSILARTAPRVVDVNAVALIGALVKSLTNDLFKVRLCVLDAVVDVAYATSFGSVDGRISESILAALAFAGNDKSISVRKRLVCIAGQLLSPVGQKRTGHAANRSNALRVFEPEALALLVCAINNDVPEVVHAALCELEIVSRLCFGRVTGDIVHYSNLLRTPSHCKSEMCQVNARNRSKFDQIRVLTATLCVETLHGFLEQRQRQQHLLTHHQKPHLTAASGLWLLNVCSACLAAPSLYSLAGRLAYGKASVIHIPRLRRDSGDRREHARLSSLTKSSACALGASLANYAAAGLLNFLPTSIGAFRAIQASRAVQFIAACVQTIFCARRMSILLARMLVDHVETIAHIHCSVADTVQCATAVTHHALCRFTKVLIELVLPSASDGEVSLLLIVSVMLLKSSGLRVAPSSGPLHDLVARNITTISARACQQMKAPFLPRAPEWVLLSSLIVSAPTSAASNFDSVAGVIVLHADPSFNMITEGRISALSLLHLIMTTSIVPDSTMKSIVEGSLCVDGGRDVLACCM
mmetsp:Transcript_25571/g.82786  ORF Transcript_25571/g.82786 Transcript_25571/m.82786 type:complete len:605 (-) Transcript_25571:1519-3333(-)